MKKIRITTRQRSYAVLVTDSLRRDLPAALKRLNLGNHAVVVTFPRLRRAFGGPLRHALAAAGKKTTFLDVPDTEKSKNAGEALRLIKKITRCAKGEDVFLVALGGGVVGDLAGFVASIYKRGVAVIQIPTTLLAQIDSSIGGKTAVDAPWGKNMLGTFYQPSLVATDIGFLRRLPERQLLAGLSEAVKYALIKDKRLFAFYEKNRRRIFRRDARTLQEIVFRCAAIKARVVERDELDKKDVRIILNFGHTFAHAFESASRYRLSHGEAVSLGMACAADLSRTLGLLKEKEHGRILRLMAALKLPVRHSQKMAWSGVQRAMAFDKKFRKDRRRFVLLERIGKTRVVENIPEGLVKRVVTARLTGIS